MLKLSTNIIWNRSKNGGEEEAAVAKEDSTKKREEANDMAVFLITVIN